MNQSINELNAANILVILKLINRSQITGEEAEAAVEVKHKLAFLHRQLQEAENTVVPSKLPVEVPSSVEKDGVKQKKKSG